MHAGHYQYLLVIRCDSTKSKAILNCSFLLFPLPLCFSIYLARSTSPTPKNSLICGAHGKILSATLLRCYLCSQSNKTTLCSLYYQYFLMITTYLSMISVLYIDTYVFSLSVPIEFPRMLIITLHHFNLYRTLHQFSTDY